MVNSPSVSAVIGLGSNLGNSRSLLQEAWQSIGQHPEITLHLQNLSSPYRTQPVGMKSEHWFVNAVGQLDTTLSPEALLDLLLETEQHFGRVRYPEREGYQDRTLDLDLLLYADQLIQTTRLTLPHPAMHERLFVLVPLAELDGQTIHPFFKKTIDELLAAVLAEQKSKTGEGGKERQEKIKEIEEIEQITW